MYRYLLLVATVALLLVMPTSASADTRLAKIQEIYIGNGTEPRELDPTLSTGVPESHIEDNLFEGLCALDPFTLDPIPGAAQSWQISKDGKVYTFKLRKGLKWSDGKRLTAHDFVYSWRRTLDPKLASEYAYQLYYIKNGRAYNEGKIKDPTKLGVVAKDDLTLVVTLEHPTPYFLRLTGFHTLYPVPKHVIDKHEGARWTREGNMVSNGAFKLAEWRLNKHVKIVPNEHYWDRKKVKLTAAYFLPIEKETTEEKAFISGRIQMTNTVPPLKIRYYQRQNKRNPNKAIYHSSPMLGTYYYRFNVNLPALKDKRVRKALAMTIDRQLLVDKVTRGGQIPATTFVPPKTGGYSHRPIFNKTLTAEDIAKAKKLLAAAGYPNGKGLPTLELLYNTNESHKKIAIAIQQMWKKHLGINITLLNQEWKVYLDSVKKLSFQVSRAGWIGDYVDANTFLDMFVTDGGNNNTGWSNKEYDNYIKLAGAELNSSKRLDIFRKAESLLLEETPIIPIYHYTNNSLVSRQVRMFDVNGNMRDWSSNVSDRINLKYYVLVRR